MRRAIQSLLFVGVLSMLSAGELCSVNCTTYSNSRALAGSGGEPYCGGTGPGCIECTGTGGGGGNYCVGTAGGYYSFCNFPDYIFPEDPADYDFVA